jgi:putative colanic acid biosynthesis UDP-glucose lipid carrier transferase
MLLNPQKAGRYRIFIACLIIAEDLLLLNFLYWGLLCYFDVDNNLTYHVLQLLISLGYLLSLVIVKNDTDFRRWQTRELLERNFYRLVGSVGVALGCLFAIKLSSDISRSFVFSFIGAAYVLLFIFHKITRNILRTTIQSNQYSEKAIILGAGVVGKKMYMELCHNVYLGIKVLGFFDDDTTKNDSTILGTVEQAKEYIKSNKVSKVYCALPLSEHEKIVDFINFSEQHIINFHIVPVIGYYTSIPVVLETVGNMPVLSIRKIPLSNLHNAILKRCFDILVSFTFLVTLFPVLYILLGAAIKFSSRGPVFFVQERTGKNGRIFRCYKFRSMRCNNEAHTKQATANDRRKTGIGAFLRRSNLDEIPQFINVLKGEMSIVGPRPHMLRHTEEYSQLLNKYMVRHFIKPGITGWAQVNGCRGETKEVSQMEERIRKDIWYIENWSFLLDIEIIVRTLILSLKGDKKAY